MNIEVKYPVGHKFWVPRVVRRHDKETIMHPDANGVLQKFSRDVSTLEAIAKQKIVDENTGETFGWGRMALRELIFKGLVIGVGSFFTFGILWVVDSLFVVREDRKTIHDMVSRSIVVNA